MNINYIFGHNDGEFEYPLPKKKRDRRLSREITTDDISEPLSKALKKLKIFKWRDLLKHTDATIIMSPLYCYGELAECLKFYNYYLPLTDVEKEMLEAFEEAGIPFDKDDLRYFLGYSSRLRVRKLIIKVLSRRMKMRPDKLQKLKEAKEILEVALE